MTRRILRIAVWTAAVLVTLLAILLIILVNPPGERLVNSWLERKLSAEIGIPVSIGEFETNLLSRVRLSRIAVFSGSEADSDTLLYVGRVCVGYGIFQLLGDTLNIRSIVLDSVFCSLSIDSLGQTGIPLVDLPSIDSMEAGEPAAFSLDTLVVSLIRAGYEDQRFPIRVEATDGALAAFGAGAGNYRGSFGIGNFCINHDGLVECVNGLNTRVRLEGQRLTIDSAQASIAGLDWRLSGSISDFKTGELDLKTSLIGNPSALLHTTGRHFELPQVSAESLAVNVQMTGSLEVPKLAADLSVKQAKIEELKFPELRGQARMTAEGVHLDTIMISGLGGEVSGIGFMTLDSIPAGSCVLRIDHLDAAQIWQAIYNETPDYRGVFSGRIEAQGAGTLPADWKAEVDLQIGSVSYLQRKIPDLQVNMVVDRGHGQVRVDQGRNLISATFQLRTDTLFGDFNLDVPDVSSLAVLFDQPDIQGRIHGSGMIGGVLENPVAECTLGGGDWQIYNFPLDSLYALIRYQDTTITIKKATCLGRIDEIDPAKPPFALTGLAGRLQYRGELHGSLDSLSGLLTASAQGILWEDYAIDSMIFRGELAGSHITMPQLEVYRDDLLLQAQAVYDTMVSEGNVELEIYSATVPDSGQSLLDSVGERTIRGRITSSISLLGDSTFSCQVHGNCIWLGLANKLDSELVTLDGTLDVEMSAAGSLVRPGGQLVFAARSIRYGDYSLDSALATVTFGGESLILDSLALFAIGQSLTGQGAIAIGYADDGSYRIDDDAVIDGIISIGDFDLSALQPFVAPAGIITGNASGKLALCGTFRNPSADGWFQVSDGYVLIDEQTTPVQDISLSLLLANSVIQVDSLNFVASGIPATLRGFLTVESLEKIRTDLKLIFADVGQLSAVGWMSPDSLFYDIMADRVDLAIAKPFLTDVDSLGGALTATINLQGSIQIPEIIGTIELTDFSAYSTAYLVALSQGQLHAVFDMQQITLDTAFASLNGGTISLTGVVSHRSGELIDMWLQLQIDSIYFHDPELYSAKIQKANLRFDKHEDTHLLDGDIHIGESRLTAGFKPQSILPWVQAAEVVEWEFPEIVARSRLDIRLRDCDQLWVDNNLARIRLLAAVNVIGTPVRPNLSGMLSIEEGYLLYLDRRFKVITGTVYFSDPSRLNPDVNLEASTKVTAYSRTTPTPYEVSIQAEGPLDQLQFGIYSNPPLDRPDIVSLLTLGATRTELTGKSGESDRAGMKNVLAERAGMLASQRTSRYFSDKVGTLFGFDEFTIQGNLFQFNESWGPQLVASRRLSDRLNFTYSTTVGHLNDQSIQLGYRLNSRFSLLGETNRYGHSSIGLKYGYRFR